MKIRQTPGSKYNLGPNIRKYRKQAGLTQENTVAKLQLLGIEISRGSYSQIECGLVSIKVEELLGLASIFSVSIEDFFEGISLTNPVLK